MRSLILILSLICSLNAVAQDSTGFENFSSSIDLLYGQKYFQKPVFAESVNNLGDFRIGRPISYVGVGFTVNLVTNRRYSYFGTMRFYHVIPQLIGVNDSISGRVSGFNFEFPFAGWDVFRNKRWIDLILEAGISTGRIRLFGDSRLERVNAYFAPCFSVTPRFVIGKFAFQFRAEYELDITRERWRNVWFSSSPKVDLGSMKSTGLSTSFSIGRTL